MCVCVCVWERVCVQGKSEMKRDWCKEQFIWILNIKLQGLYFNRIPSRF